MSEEQFFKHPGLPFVEYRRSKNSGRHYKPHMHTTFSVGAIDQGEVIYHIDGKTAPLQPGSLALINPESLHYCNPTNHQKRSYCVLYLDVAWCLQLQQSLWQTDAFRPVRISLLEDQAIYRQYIDTMDLLLGDGDLLEKEQHLVDIMETLFLTACEPAAPVSEPSSQVEQLKLLLGKDLDSDLSMGQLASALQANPYTLLRQFKAATGITPHAYRLNCRIEHARNLLQKGMDLSQVALECGFFDQSHFHRHFKAITAVTPREYQLNFIQ